jgi:hypothetical protein
MPTRQCLHGHPDLTLLIVYVCVQNILVVPYHNNLFLSVPAESLCNCSSEGVLDVDDCDKKTGQCVCMSGYTGLLCEDCEEGHFTNGTTSCIACGCDSYGAVNHLCDR